MLKRVLCVLTSIALVLAMMPSVVATSGELVATGTVGNNTLTFSWNYEASEGGEEVSYYTYTIINSTAGTTLASNTRTQSTTVTKAYTASGTYVLTVSAYDASGEYLATAASTVSATYLPSSTTSGITVAAVSDSSVVVSWTANVSYASYTVTYVTASGTTYTAGITTSTSYTLAVAYSSLKSVTVVGYTGTGGTGTGTTVGTWAQSSSSSSSTSSGVTATNNGYNSSYGAFSYSFSWTAVSDASYYYVATTTGSGSSSSYATVSASYSAYLLPGYTYYVVVYAVSSSGTTSVVGTITVTTGSPPEITCTENGYMPWGYYSYTFEWEAYNDEAYSYDIYYNDEYVASTTETTYTDSYVDNGTYTITVYAKDENDELLGEVGSASFEITPVENTAEAIKITRSSIGVVGSYMKVLFTWDEVDYATYYEVCYTSSTGEEETLIIEDCSYAAVIKLGTTYSFSVKAYSDRDRLLNQGGLYNWSVNSSSSSTKTEAVICELAGITSDGDDRYTVSYNPYDGATHYQVTAYEVSGTSYVLTDTSDYTTELETTLDLEDGKTYRIYVYAYDPSYYRLGLVGYTDITTDASVAENAEFTFTLPFYGTLSAGDEITVTLPSSLTTDESVVLPIEYSITLNGVTVKLKGSDGTGSGVYEQTVEIGMFARDYFSSEEITVDAMLPELTEVSTTSDIVITASVDCSEYDGAPIISAEDLSSTYGSLMTVTADHIWHEGLFADISSSYVALYSITSSATGGTVSTDLISAASGLTVTVEASAESGYELSGVTVTDADGASVAVTDCGDGTYTFTMPSSAVTVSADISHAHSLTKTDAVDETCLTDGNIEYWYCSVCGNYYSDEDCTTEIALEDTVIGATGHDYKSVVTNPTCTEGGYTTYTCSNCGDSYVADETAALGHDYEAVVTEPTCTEGGYATHTCSTCGDTYTDSETEALGHNYESEVTTEATCTEAGVKTYTCSRCGDTYTEEIPATGHNYVATETTATCTDGGYTTYVCSECGDAYTDSETEALGHDYESVVTKEPTCTETGVMTYTCSRCGDTYTEEIPATGHTTEIKNAKDATCTEDGYTGDEVCTVCGEVVTAGETIEATGHTTEIRNAKDATCTEDGYTGDEVCTVCGETITVGTVIPATGHSFNSEGVCEACGAKTGEDGTASTVTVESDDTIFANVLPSGLVTSATISISNDNGGTLVVSTVVEVSAYPYLVEHIADTLSFTLYNEAQGDDLISDTNSFTITTTENNRKTLKKVSMLFYGDVDYSGTGTSTVTMDFASTSDLSSSDIYVLHYTGSYPTWEVVTSTVTFVDTTVTVEFEASDYSPFVVLSVASASSGGSSSVLDILLRISANYSEVTEAIDRANALNPSDYENFSAVTEAINAVNWNLKAINQLTVNAYADAINTAIDSLVKTTATITEETVNIDEPIEDTNTDTEDDIF